MNTVGITRTLERLGGRNLAHLTPRYIFDRCLVAFDQLRRPADPWLTRPAISILESWLRPDDVGFEWGSGRSTVWFARRVRRLVSIEHDPAWYETVRERLARAGLLDRCDCRLEPDGRDETPNSRYVRAVEEVLDNTLDFALVDGVARVHCALAVLSKLRPGGLLCIDNANWFLPGPAPSRSPNSRNEHGPANASWAELAEQLRSWRCIWTSNGVFDTAFWVKSAA
jgi:hypothetical protein